MFGQDMTKLLIHGMQELIHYDLFAVRGIAEVGDPFRFLVHIAVYFGRGLGLQPSESIFPCQVEPAFFVTEHKDEVMTKSLHVGDYIPDSKAFADDSPLFHRLIEIQQPALMW